MYNLFWYQLGKKRGGGVETESPILSLNMTSGDQIVTPSEGKLLSQVTIEKPDTLAPENIAEGIDIAGIIGTLAAGSGVRISTGTISATSSSNLQVNHTLGVVPDLVLFQGYDTSSTSYIGFAFGAGDKLRNVIPLKNVKCTGTTKVEAKDYSITTTYTSIPINNATSSSFCISGSSSVQVGKNGKWIAIAGLT